MRCAFASYGGNLPAFALALTLLSGCGVEANRQTPALPEVTVDAQSEAESAVEPAPKEVTLEVVDKPGLDKVLASKRGKVVLVDMWATWCAPCKEGFPHLVEIAKKYRPQGLAVVTLSLDEEDAHQEALEFLKQQDARFTNLRSKQGASEEAIQQFEIDGGSIPHVRLYDRQGKLVKKFVSGDPDAVFSHEDVDLAVRRLLTQQ